MKTDGMKFLYGACGIHDHGRGLYFTGLGHGDAQHSSDPDPTRPGLETFSIHENPSYEYGIEMCGTHTPVKSSGANPSPDVGRGLAIDIDPRHPGHEC